MSTLSTLFVRNLVFSGVHGSTGRESFDPQRFSVDIDVTLDISEPAKSDDIKDTYDYKDAVSAARFVVEREHHVLIEKIATRIADRITLNTKVASTKVMLSKLEASHNALPGIIVEKKRSPQEFDRRLLDFDIDWLMKKLQKENGVSFPILTDSYRKLLLEDALSHEYEKQPEIVGAAKVREQLSSVKKFHQGSLFYAFRQEFQNLLEDKLRSLAEYPLRHKLDLNEMSLQLYEKGSIGITPHVDGLSCANFICVFILTGHAKFAFCDDRSGSNPKYLDTSPGNLIIFRAPGFMHSDFRPFHFLSDVTEKRIVFGLRQQLPKNN